MILGTDYLLELVSSHNLVENLSQRELENPEGAGFDLRVGKIQILSKGGGYLGIEERRTADVELIAEYNADEVQPVTIEPHRYYLVTTIEKVNLPINILALFRPRSTLYRSGVTLFTGNASPGYSGELSFGLINVGPLPFTLEMGARIVHAMFYEVKGGTNTYRGQWQGGRTHASDLEVQV
ncbi:hypothetical protein HGA91_00995 [candidate division WWE3 bacterium]|nr:hypothetical protein [candidate division WWE3 bacterium]